MLTMLSCETAYGMLLKIRRLTICDKIGFAYQRVWSWVACLGFHATGQTNPRFSREALDGEGVCCNQIRPKIGVDLGLTVNQRGTSK